MESSVKAIPKIVKLNQALKLAESWVNSMSETTEDWKQLEPVARPHRLGLGARERPSARASASTDPVERKLLGKLKPGKKLWSKDSRKDSPAEEGRGGISSDDDDEPESRTNAVAKRRTLPLVSTQQLKKRK